MSEQILKAIYEITKNFRDPISNVALDKSYKNLSIILKNGNVSISLAIKPDNEKNYQNLVNNLKSKISKIEGILSLNVILTSEENSNQMNLISHIYNEPGVKSIKIIVIRFSKNDQWILETSLITKNIVINDGNFQSCHD